MIPATGESAHDIFRLVQTGGAFGLFGDLIADFPDVIYQFVLGLFYFVNSLLELGQTLAQTAGNLGQPSTEQKHGDYKNNDKLNGPGRPKPQILRMFNHFSLLITQSRYYNAI